MNHIVWNLEPEGFASHAKSIWEKLGCYFEGTIDDCARLSDKQKVTIIIVRLARRVDSLLLAEFPSLRYVVSATTGLDHIDQVCLGQRGIEIVSLRGEQEFLQTISSTAEHAFALLLAGLRSLTLAAKSVESGLWQRDRFRGRQLQGRSIGIIGLGRTGMMMARYSECFGAKVRYYDPWVNSAAWEKTDDLLEIMARSDIVSVHVHLDDSTRNLIGEKELEALPVGSMVINTSRGGIIDEARLVHFLSVGKISCVAVDVLEGELEGVKNNCLWRAMKSGLNVIITPHIGGATIDAMRESEIYIAQKFIKSRGLD